MLTRNPRDIIFLILMRHRLECSHAHNLMPLPKNHLEARDSNLLASEKGIPSAHFGAAAAPSRLIAR
jgi:hypothetical protein